MCVCVCVCARARARMHNSNCEGHKLKSTFHPAGTRIIDSKVVRGLHDLNKFFRRGVNEIFALLRFCAA